MKIFVTNKFNFKTLIMFFLVKKITIGRDS